MVGKWVGGVGMRCIYGCKVLSNACGTRKAGNAKVARIEVVVSVRKLVEREYDDELCW